MIGKTKDAARFKVVKEELGKHFATQSLSDAADTARAFKILQEPKYGEPTEPEFPLRLLKKETVDGTDSTKVNPRDTEFLLTCIPVTTASGRGLLNIGRTTIPTCLLFLCITVQKI